MTRAEIRIALPYHLRNLARTGSEITLEVATPVTANTILDALESQYPMLRGTIRDHVTHQRRDFVRYFGCQRDMSHDPPDAPLPEPIVDGREPFIIWGALAGG